VFTDDFLDHLPEEPIQAAIEMCVSFLRWHNALEARGPIVVRQHHGEYLDAFAAMEAFVQASGLPIDTPELGGTPDEVPIVEHFFNEAYRALTTMAANLRLSEGRHRFGTRFGSLFVYEFSEGDLDRIQRLLNELRDLVVSSEIFDAKHKDRILKRLETLQRELHKKMPSLDKFWGLVGDAGVVLGKFGRDAKPFVDRMKEIAQIVWRTQARTEELPTATPFPMLSAPPKADVDAPGH
jgi:hypothetical protein